VKGFQFGEIVTVTWATCETLEADDAS